MLIPVAKGHGWGQLCPHTIRRRETEDGRRRRLSSFSPRLLIVPKSRALWSLRSQRVFRDNTLYNVQYTFFFFFLNRQYNIHTQTHRGESTVYSLRFFFFPFIIIPSLPHPTPSLNPSFLVFFKSPNINWHPRGLDALSLSSLNSKVVVVVVVIQVGGGIGSHTHTHKQQQQQQQQQQKHSEGGGVGSLSTLLFSSLWQPYPPSCQLNPPPKSLITTLFLLLLPPPSPPPSSLYCCYFWSG